MISNEANNLQLEQEIKIFTKVIDERTRKESKEASIVVIAVKEINLDKSQVILSNSFDKKIDTNTVIHQNNLWLVDL